MKDYLTHKLLEWGKRKCNLVGLLVCKKTMLLGSAVTFGAEMQCCMLRVTVYADGSSLPSR